MKSELRIPKTEITTPQPLDSGFGFRVSGFFRTSVFEFRN
jgi:hypothetical protein